MRVDGTSLLFAAAGTAIVVGVGAVMRNSSGGKSGGGLQPPPASGVWVGPPLPGLPQGKGVFVRHVRHGGDPSLFVERCKWLGLRWVMLQAIWQKPDSRDTVVNDPVETAEYAAALRDAGITPWVFGWPRPESKNIVQFVDAAERARSMAAAAGVVINPEAPWFGMRTQAVQLMYALRQAMPSSSRIGMTSYGGGPPNVPAFPWSEFASADFGVPQIYDTKHSLGPDYPQRSVRRWIAGGYPVVVPAWGASNAHTPAQMMDIASRTPLPVSACCWWDLYWILQSKGRANAVRDFAIPPPGTVTHE